MAFNRLPPDGRNPIQSRGRLIIDTYRGRMRTRAWPRKSGSRMTYKQRWFTSRFAEAAKLAKFAPPAEYQRAVDLAHGTGLYPGDLIRSAILGGSFDQEDETGAVWTRYHAMVHPMQFQGARIIKTSPQSIAANTNTSVVFQEPVLDTAGFWNPGDPNRITIPDDVEIVALTAGIRSTDNVTGQYVGWIQDQAGVRYAMNETDTAGGDSVNVATGPLRVSPEDWFEVRVFFGAARTINALPSTFFSLEVLGAL